MDKISSPKNHLPANSHPTSSLIGFVQEINDYSSLNSNIQTTIRNKKSRSNYQPAEKERRRARAK